MHACMHIKPYALLQYIMTRFDHDNTTQIGVAACYKQYFYKSFTFIPRLVLASQSFHHLIVIIISCHAELDHDPCDTAIYRNDFQNKMHHITFLHLRTLVIYHFVWKFYSIKAFYCHRKYLFFCKSIGICLLIARNFALIEYCTVIYNKLTLRTRGSACPVIMSTVMQFSVGI